MCVRKRFGTFEVDFGDFDFGDFDFGDFDFGVGVYGNVLFTCMYAYAFICMY